MPAIALATYAALPNLAADDHPWEVWRADARANAAEHDARLRTLIARHGVMVQPFVPDIIIVAGCAGLGCITAGCTTQRRRLRAPSSARRSPSSNLLALLQCPIEALPSESDGRRLGPIKT
jgi:hypothetical protein